MKKILFLFAAIFLSGAAIGTTYVAVQLINPTGSTAGEAIISTGPSSAPEWGGVGVNGIGALAANTVLANATAASAAPTAFAMPSCSTSSSAIEWTTSTGFTCNSSINAATLDGATFASPPSTGYGSATPEPVAATTLSASGNDALLYTNTSGQSISNSTQTIITTWTKTFDRLSANFNATTGVFTAPATGYYQVSAQVLYTTHTGLVDASYTATIVANSVTIASGLVFQQSTSSVAVTVQVSAVVFMTSGQTLTLQTLQNTGSTLTLGTSAASTYLSINRIP